MNVRTNLVRNLFVTTFKLVYPPHPHFYPIADARTAKKRRLEDSRRELRGLGMMDGDAARSSNRRASSPMLHGRGANSNPNPTPSDSGRHSEEDEDDFAFETRGELRGKQLFAALLTENIAKGESVSETGLF